MKRQIKRIGKKEQIKVLEKLSFHLYKNGFHPELHDDMLDVSNYLLISIPGRKEFSLNFEMDTNSTWASGITLEIMKYATSIHYDVQVYDPFVLILNEEETEVVEVLFGEDALHYHETGEMPKAKSNSATDNDKKDEELIDVQKKVDNILDQISKQGLDSLKPSQRKFLKKYSNQSNDTKKENKPENPDRENESK